MHGRTDDANVPDDTDMDAAGTGNTVVSDAKNHAPLTNMGFYGLQALAANENVEPLERPGKLAPEVHQAMTRRLLRWTVDNPGIPIPQRTSGGAVPATTS